MGKRNEGQEAGDGADLAGGLMMEMEDVMHEELEKMKDMDIREADKLKLSDIREIKISGDLSEDEKRREFIRQIGNPYLYKQGEYIVKLKFADTEVTLTDRLKEYIEHVVFVGEEYGANIK